MIPKMKKPVKHAEKAFGQGKKYPLNNMQHLFGGSLLRSQLFAEGVGIVLHGRDIVTLFKPRNILADFLGGLGVFIQQNELIVETKAFFGILLLLVVKGFEEVDIDIVFLCKAVTNEHNNCRNDYQTASGRHETSRKSFICAF